MNYAEQQQIEKLNREILTNIVNNVKAEEFIDFYKGHNQSETMAKYGLRTAKQLRKVLLAFNYDFSYKKALNKGKSAARSHESYVAGGQKSASTQQAHWAAKSDLELAAWANKQKVAHATEEFKSNISKINKDYWASRTEEELQQIKAKKSKGNKKFWNNLSESERIAVQDNRFKNDGSYRSKASQPNSCFAKKLTQAGIAFDQEYCCDRKRFDFKVANTLIEIDSTITHNITYTPFSNSQPLTKDYHKLMTKTANDHGFRCIHIFDWDDQDKIIRLLKNNSKSIYARDCIVELVPKQLAKEFILANHLQGYVKDEIRLGLFYEGALVSIMTFGKPRYNKKYSYELLRYCASEKIIGGSNRLFKHFINMYKPDSIISYCDLSKFDGKTYQKLGFTLKQSPAPSKHWYKISTKRHITDSLLRQRGFSQLIHGCKAKDDIGLVSNDNRALMINEGFYEVYDCGQALFIWNK